jgi:RNA polymerase sigma factor (sigma-70 family)
MHPDPERWVVIEPEAESNEAATGGRRYRVARPGHDRRVASEPETGPDETGRARRISGQTNGLTLPGRERETETGGGDSPTIRTDTRGRSYGTRRQRRGAISVQPLHNPLAPVPPQRVLVPIIGVNDELLPSTEDRLHPIALRAKAGDRNARNGLYAAFEQKIHRIASRLTIPTAFGTDTGVWDRHDVEQEAFIAFTDLVDVWIETIPFGRYVLANLPWRLRDAVYRGVGRRNVPPRTMAVTPDRAHWLTDDSAAAAEAKALIVTLAVNLEEPQRSILVSHICDGKSLTDIARDLEISRRTVTRHWLQIRQDLAGDLVRPVPDD